MVSPEVIRRYPFFAGLRHHQMACLTSVSHYLSAEPDKYFFHEGEDLKYFYLVIEGIIALSIEIPTGNKTVNSSNQLLGNPVWKDVTVTTVGPGDIFGWSALIPPHKATASAKAITPCQVVSFDCNQLLPIFQTDCRFGYQMTQKAAQVIRDRLQDLLVESLTFFDG